MKKFLLITAGAFFSVAAFAQGLVDFRNASTISGWNPVADRIVRFGGGATLISPLLVPGAPVSSNYAGVNLSSYRAALYYAPGITTDLALFSQAAGGWATFKSSTSATAGSWFGGTRTLTTVAAQGGLASLFVVVWDSSRSTDPLSPAARNTVWGSSAIFVYITPTSPTPVPADFLMNNLSSFTIDWIPEPSAFALTALGAAALLFCRRSKLSRHAVLHAAKRSVPDTKAPKHL